MIPINLLLALQLENYDIVRFLKFAYSHFKFWVKWSSRQRLVRTNKAIAIFVLVMVIFVSVLLLEYYFLISRLFFLSILIDILLLPLFFVIWMFVLMPIDYLLEYNLVRRAKSKVKENNQVKIIWITWSYGKTSVKEFLKNLLDGTFEVIAPINTHNTLLWISNFVLKDLKNTTEIMIVEMWAYVQGDIKKLCNIVKPHFAVITGITKQHLDRFKTIDSIINTKFEITQQLAKGDMLFVDWENEYIEKWILSYCKQALYSIERVWNIDVEYKPDFQWISFEYKWETYDSRLLWKHNAKNLALAIEVALNCWVPIPYMKEKIKNMKFVPHRLELIYNASTWVSVIDDSFNWNIEWVKSTIDLLRKTPFKWKKIYLTPGLVELWEESDSVHFDIWCDLANCVDKVILIKTPWTERIKEGLISKWFNLDDIIVFDNSESAHKDVWQYASRWDVIIFQNDLTDNYF